MRCVGGFLLDSWAVGRCALLFPPSSSASMRKVLSRSPAHSRHFLGPWRALLPGSVEAPHASEELPPPPPCHLLWWHLPCTWGSQFLLPGNALRSDAAPAFDMLPVVGGIMAPKEFHHLIARGGKHGNGNQVADGIKVVR